MAKQVIVIRRDLKMRRGKEIAQGAHASMKWLADKIQASIICSSDGEPHEDESHSLMLSPAERGWIAGKFTKICVQVESEGDLLAVHLKARAAGLTSRMILDSGATEFNGKETFTALAIGPNDDAAIDAITGDLRLY